VYLARSGRKSEAIVSGIEPLYDPFALSFAPRYPVSSACSALWFVGYVCYGSQFRGRGVSAQAMAHTQKNKRGADAGEEARAKRYCACVYIASLSLSLRAVSVTCCALRLADERNDGCKNGCKSEAIISIEPLVLPLHSLFRSALSL
jgi:hypothetical protein